MEGSRVGYGEGLRFLWQPCPGGARLLRLYGDTPCPVVPPRIAGRPVAEVGPYCFSAREPGPGGQLWGDGAADSLHPICDAFLQEITLPDSVRALHNAAFYNCRSLRRLCVGAGLESLGSDLFTNCRALTTLAVRAAPDAPTGLKKLLGALNADVGVDFLTDAGVQARLFYPEYSEYLDENTPAHIFNRSIEGEGYRLRQCFDGGVLRFAEYDAVFAHAADVETAASLGRIALGRLQFPFALAEEARRAYAGYLAAHVAEAGGPVIAGRDAAALRLLAGLAASDDRRALALGCGKAGWSEGAALALAGAGQRAEHGPKRYDFDDL